jgi:hypothetical protein
VDHVQAGGADSGSGDFISGSRGFRMRRNERAIIYNKNKLTNKNNVLL